MELAGIVVDVGGLVVVVELVVDELVVDDVELEVVEELDVDVELPGPPVEVEDDVTGA